MSGETKRGKKVLTLADWPKAGHCLFPHGNVGTEDFHFCGAKIETDLVKKRYCDQHLLVVVAYSGKRRPEAA